MQTEVDGAAAAPESLCWNAESFSRCEVCFLELQSVEKKAAAALLHPHTSLRLPDHPDGLFTYCPLWSVHLFSLLIPAHANELIALAEAHASTHGWSTRRHRHHPTTDLQVSHENCPAIARRLEQTIEVALQTLAHHYGFERSHLTMSDCFLVKYEAKDEEVAEADEQQQQDRLTPHRDGSLLSFSILLSQPGVDFTGGGLSFASLRENQPVPNQGDLTIHCGKLLHESKALTSGRRYVLVGFVAVDAPHLIDAEFVERSVHANTSSVGGWADYEIIEECLL